MAELPGWIGKVTELAKSIAQLTGNVEGLQREVERLQAQMDRSNDRIRQLEQDLAVARAELKGEAQTAALNTVIQAHEQMITRIHRVEDTVRRRLPPPDEV